MDEKQPDTDVNEIQKKISEAIALAENIREKVFGLNNRSEKIPGKITEEKPTGDIGTQIKEALDQLRNIQKEAYAALNEFV